MGIFSQMAEKKEDASAVVVDANANKTQPIDKVEPVTGIDDVVADQTGVGKQEPPPVEPRHVRTEAMDSLKLRAQVVRDHVFELKAEPWMELATDGKLQARYQALLLAIRSVMEDGGLTPEEAACLLNEAMAERQFALVSMKLGLDVHVRDAAQLFDEMFVENLRKIPSMPLTGIESTKGVLQSLKDSTDCGQAVVGEVQERINDLILLCNLELAKLENLNKGADEIIAAPKPASTPPAPAQELTGKTHDTPDAVRAADTAEVDAVLDKLPADPGAPTVASQASPTTSPQEDSKADEAQTGIMPATDRSITRATPIPPPLPETDLASPEDVVSMDAVTTSLRIIDPYDVPPPAAVADPAAAMLAATPPAPSAGPTPPEPDADLAFAPTAAQPITPPQGVLATPAPETTPEPTPKKGRQLIFRIVQGNGLVRTVNLVEPMIKVGKLTSSHLRLDDSKVSRMHAIIENEGDEVFVVDLGSSNGTLVNGARVNKTKLQHGDVLQFGDTVVELEISQVQAETPAPTDSAHTPPLGGMGRDTNVGNPTDVSVAPAPDQNDGLDEVAKLVAAYLAAPIAERLRGEHRQNYRTLFTILSTEVKNEKPKVAQRAKRLLDELQTAFQLAEFAQKVDMIDLTAPPMSTDALSALPEFMLERRHGAATEFRRNRDTDPLTPDVGKLVQTFLEQYEAALANKQRSQPPQHPIPDPAVPHGPGSRPAEPPPSPPPSTVPAAPDAFRNSFERAHGALPGQWASSPATPDSAAAPDQAPALRSEALTGEAPAAASQAAPLPFAVISTHQPQAQEPQAAPPSNIEVSPSLAPPPWAPAPVHSRRNQPTDPPAPTGRSVSEMPTVEENVRRSNEKNRTTLRDVAGYVFYGLASLAALSIMVAAILVAVNTATTNREVVERTAESTSQAARETTASTRELLQQLAAMHGGNKIPPGAMAGADGSLSLPRPMANAPAPGAGASPTSGMRCRPAPQPACGNLPIDTPMSATSGPGYECPANNGPIALGLRRGWDVCHCQWCQ